MRGSPPHTAGEGGSLPRLQVSLAKASLSWGQVPPHAPPPGPPFWAVPHPMPLPLPCPAVLRPVHPPEAQGAASGLGTSPATPRGTPAASLTRSPPLTSPPPPLTSPPPPYASGGFRAPPPLTPFLSLTRSPICFSPEPPEGLPRALSHGPAKFDNSASPPPACQRVCAAAAACLPRIRCRQRLPWPRPPLHPTAQVLPERRGLQGSFGPR